MKRALLLAVLGAAILLLLTGCAHKPKPVCDEWSSHHKCEYWETPPPAMF